MNQEAIAIVQKCLETQDPYLDLGRLGLRDADFAEGTELDRLLRQCSHLETLVLSNSWYQWEADGERREQRSRNTGTNNHFTTHPPALLGMIALKSLFMGGDGNPWSGRDNDNGWGISDMSFVTSLITLEELNLSYNLVNEIRGLDGLSSLQQLILYNNQISEIRGLKGLSSLQQLDIGYNQISEIRGLEGLSSLQQLDLGSNEISEIRGLEGLSSLQQLDLYNNQISEICGLEGLSSLQQLDLYNNQISEIRGLEGLSSLQQLGLDNNQISEIRGLEGLSSLQRLDLDNNRISEIRGLEGLSSLQQLNLYSNHISEIRGLEGLSSLQQLSLYSNHISEIRGLEGLSSLQHLSIGGNRISEIRGLEGLSSLQRLDLDNNRISEILGLEGLSSLQQLDLSRNEISKIRGLEGLSSLQHLYLNSNQISEIRGLEGLSSLQHLGIGGNRISEIRGLEGLSSLQHLYLNSNQISEIHGLEGLSSLQQLYLNSNQISEIRGLEGLSSLQQLDLSRNEISKIRGLEGLSSLQQLSIGGNRISEIRGLEGLSSLQQLDLSGNGISEIRGLDGLSSLQQLNLKENRIGEIRGLTGLTSLQQLNLWGNHISEIGGLEDFSTLQQLDLSYNQISEVRGLSGLIALQELNIGGNHISDISSLQPWLRRTECLMRIVLKQHHQKLIKGDLNVYGNPLTTPPMEVVKRGNAAVLRYFEKIAKEGQDYIYEAKLILVGEGSAGKTSLQVRLQNAQAKLPQQDKRTRGIQIADWPFKTSKGRPHIAHIWDFGGQDVYYPVHRFFLTENAVFVLLASTRQTTHNFDYWIPTIFQFGGKSPIILGQTCHDGNKVAWNDLGYYIGSDNFNIIKTGVLPYQELNLIKKNEGLVKIKKTIVEQLTSLPHYGEGVPKTWVTVRDKIAAMAKKTACIPFSQFKTFCKDISKDGFADAIAVDDCAGFLHSIGVVLWYADITGLKDWVVLQPEWAMNAVYKIIDDADIQKRRGIILAKDFKRLWSEGCYEDMHDVLKQMLEIFKIAFPKKHPKGDYIIPARLLSMPAEARWQIAEPCLRLEYKYEFMPRGMVNQLSAELSRYIIADEQVWNDAVNFKNNDASCQVTEDFYNRLIRIVATGKDARALVMLVMNGLQDITDGYRGVIPQIIVPCTCKKCEKSTKPITFEYDRLLEWSRERELVTCNNSGETLRIDDLLYNVGLRNPEKEKNTSSMNKTIKVFLASSAELKSDREKFEIFINRENKRLNEQGIFIELNLWEDFIDAMSQTRLQDEYNKVVRGCDIFVSLFFTKVGKYTAEEFEQAFGQFKATGKPYIYTYFKDEDVKIDKLNRDDINSKFDFQEKLSRLGHFPTHYLNIEDLKLQFKTQLEKLLPSL